MNPTSRPNCGYAAKRQNPDCGDHLLDKHVDSLASTPKPAERVSKAEAAEIAKIHEKQGHHFACTWCGAEPKPAYGELRG